MRRLLWPLLLIAVAAAATVVLVPTLTIHPFRPRVPRPPARVSPSRQRCRGRDAAGRHVLNALSHRSGVGVGGGRAPDAVPVSRYQQPELHHAGRRDRILVATGDGARDRGADEREAAHTRPS